MDIITTKIVILVTLLLLTLLMSMLPLKLISKVRHTFDPHKRECYRRILSLISCFAGGVFLGTCLLDLLPEVESSFAKIAASMNVELSFPIPQFVMVFGFFLVLITEQIVLDYKERNWTLEHQPLLTSDAEDDDDPPIVPVPERVGRHRHPSIEGIRSQPQTPVADVEDAFTGDLGHGHSHGELSDDHSPMRSLLLVLALSLHSVFEGMAIGLQTEVDTLLQIFSAVTIHKCIIAFSLSLNLVQSGLKLRSIVESNLVFCLTSPIGIGLGMWIDDLGRTITTEIANGTLQGIACGTFLYVTFFEVLPHEMNTAQDRLLKVLFVLIGFTTVCAVLFFSP